MKSEEMISVVVILLVFAGALDGRKVSNCGKRLNFTPLIVNGSSSDTHWPWHAAIYHKNQHDEKKKETYACGGTLINSQTILTAAHCVSEYNLHLSPQSVLVLLGKINLSVKENSTQSFQAVNIIVHPDFNSIDLDNDIALIQLNANVEFNTYVQPVCLWDSVKLGDVNGHFGTVVGWGLLNTNTLATILQQAFFPLIPPWMCIKRNRFLYGTLISDTNFCAGLGNGTSACSGDSGGSMTFESDGSYYIRGIVSKIPAKHDNDGPPCDSNEYAIFTDVAQFLPWIEQSNSEINGIQCEKSVRCHSFTHHNDSGGLTCNFDVNITISEGNCKIIFEELSEPRVTALVVWQTVETLPDLSDALSKFGTIDYLGFGFIKMVTFERSKLSFFSNVRHINFWGNMIEHIASDSFDDLKGTEILALADNRLKTVHRDLFKGLTKLREIHLQQNQLQVLPDGIFRNNQDLEKIYASDNLLKVIATDFGNLPKLVAIDFSRNDCIDEWCSLDNFCGTVSLQEMHAKIWNKCKA